MQVNHGQTAGTNHVSALFAGSAVSFSLSKGATFADLAESLEELGDRHTGGAHAVFLRFGGANQPFSALHSGI